MTNKLPNHPKARGLRMVLNGFTYVAHDAAGADRANPQVHALPSYLN